MSILHKILGLLFVGGWAVAGVYGAGEVELAIAGGTVLRFSTPAPVLWNGERLPEPKFDAAGAATVAGLKLKRTIEKNAGGYRIRLSVTNTRDQEIALKSLIPLQVAGQSDLLVAGTPATAWTVFRLARHKNDIPGPYRPTTLNDASRDAAVDSSGGTRSDEPEEAKMLGDRFHSDPGFVIMPDDQPDTTHLFIGFDGQTEHLNDIVLQVDQARTKLERLTATAEFDGVVVRPGETRATHDLYIQSGKSCDALLADHVDRIRKRYGSRLADKRNVFCTWYFYGPEIVADDLRADLKEMKRRPVKFDTFLIDYGWSQDFGDWTADAVRFPQGMKEIAGEIRAAGLVPGIWTCPFLIAPNAAALEKYPDLPLKNRAGNPVQFSMAGIGTGRFFVVDPTAPSAKSFLTELCRKLRGWGYDYLKFDFLRGVVINEDAVFHDRAMNRAQAYRRGMEILRQAAGADAMIGTWGGLFEANAGVVNINRPGSDVRGHWDPVPASARGTGYPIRMRQTFARAIYDEKLWTSDQDALQLRRRTQPWRTAKPHLSTGVFTDEEAFSTVVYRFLGGGVVQVSEKLDELDQDRYDLYKLVIPTYAPVAERFGAWDDYLPEYFVSHFNSHPSLPPWAIVSLCNWNGHAAQQLAFKLASVPGLPKAEAYAAFEFKTQKFLGVFKREDLLRLDLPVHAVRLIRLTPIRGNGTYLIGTDLNLSGGMEIERLAGKRVTLRPEVREFPEHCTLLDWKEGKASVETVAAPGG